MVMRQGDRVPGQFNLRPWRRFRLCGIHYFSRQPHRLLFATVVGVVGALRERPQPPSPKKFTYFLAYQLLNRFNPPLKQQQ